MKSDPDPYQESLERAVREAQSAWLANKDDPGNKLYQAYSDAVSNLQAYLEGKHERLTGGKK
jgi:hypothetical protein